MDEQALYESHQAMFRNAPISFVVSVLLIPVFGLGLIILLIWWLRVLGTTLTVTNERVTLRKGILSKHTTEVYHTDVRSVQLSQSFWQRLFNVGAIGIASAGQEGVEIQVKGIPNPEKVKDIIDQHRREK